MAKSALLDATAYFGGALSTSDMMAQLRSGFAQFEPSEVGMLFRKEITNQTAGRPRFKQFAAEVSQWILEDFDKKLIRLCANAPAYALLLSSPRKAYDAGTYKLFPIHDLRAKLPSVVKKIQAGDLTRFLNLIQSVHRYGFCIRCQAMLSFTALVPSRTIAPMWTIYDVPEDDIILTARLGHTDYLQIFRSIVGFCSNAQCRPQCQLCLTEIPHRYIPEEVIAHLDDRMCAQCAARQLVNVKRPKFTRFEQRRLRRLIIQ